MALFERAFSIFTPFAKPEQPQSDEKAETAKPKQESGSSAVSPEIAELKAQLAAMQAQLDRLSKGASAGDKPTS